MALFEQKRREVGRLLVRAGGAGSSGTRSFRGLTSIAVTEEEITQAQAALTDDKVLLHVYGLLKFTFGWQFTFRAIGVPMRLLPEVCYESFWTTKEQVIRTISNLMLALSSTDSAHWRDTPIFESFLRCIVSTCGDDDDISVELPSIKAIHSVMRKLKGPESYMWSQIVMPPAPRSPHRWKAAQVKRHGLVVWDVLKADGHVPGTTLFCVYGMNNSGEDTFVPILSEHMTFLDAIRAGDLHTIYGIRRHAEIKDAKPTARPFEDGCIVAKHDCTGYDRELELTARQMLSQFFKNHVEVFSKGSDYDVDGTVRCAEFPLDHFDLTGTRKQIVCSSNPLSLCGRPQLDFPGGTSSTFTTTLRCHAFRSKPLSRHDPEDCARVRLIPIADLIRCAQEDLLVMQLISALSHGEPLDDFLSEPRHEEVLRIARAFVDTEE